MHDYTKNTTPEMREADAHEMLVGDHLPVRYSGPSLYLWWRAETERQDPEHGTWIISQPLLDYTEAVIQVEWKTVDPTHKLRFDLRWTINPDYALQESRAPWIDMLPMLDMFDRKKSRFLYPPALSIYPPALPSGENRMILRYRDLYATHLGLGLLASPRNARAEARIWMLLFNRREEKT